MSHLELFSRCLIGLVFVISAVEKAGGRARFREFRSSLSGMRVLPAGLVGPVAGLVVAGEVTVPLLLLAPWPSEAAPFAGFTVATLLLGGFTTAIAAVLRRGTPAACRCFGGADAPFGRRHVARNLALAAVAAAGAIATVADQPVTWRAVVAVPAAVLCAVIVARLDDLVALFTPAPAARR
ncbi:methylamine utilization protein MauE [Actinoplanes sp. ATCC 53533]|uniref:MauE/DoxX family redox-associated membrane protein n=1 Tax=Actinoplanes sp. ATCC 53533 TaxID=1288362 RepID=UPI000F79F8D8|nr:MauE/DoxX family redox-associated membrane protein [Actinoplanes sp. ATCC 53533]RSM59803.1 methylamine utilization protein MauE [Actinoplanes sp. ATCC 53533]